MEDFEKDVLNDFFQGLNEKISEELITTEEELIENINKVNSYLAVIDKNIKLAEEEGDEALYNLEVNRKQLILQKLNELDAISNKIKHKRG